MITHLERLENKKVFIRKYMNLCDKSFNINRSYTGHKTKNGKLLVSIARMELEYSTRTYDGDIYYGLYLVYLMVK